MNHVDNQLEELRVLYGIDSKPLRKYADMILRHYHTALGSNLVNNIPGNVDEDRKRAVYFMQYKNHDNKEMLKWSLVYLSNIGELDSMVNQAIADVTNEFQEEREIFIDIYTRYYGMRQNLTEERLKEVTQYGKTQAYRIKNEALEAFGLFFDKHVLAGLAEKLGMSGTDCDQNNEYFVDCEGEATY